MGAHRASGAGGRAVSWVLPGRLDHVYTFRELKAPPTKPNWGTVGALEVFVTLD